jgi:hypothetical protein
LTLIDADFINYENEEGEQILDRIWFYTGIEIDKLPSINFVFMNQFLIKGANNHKENNQTIMFSISKKSIYTIDHE